tara:strand:- start:37 stop:354 length:318 start_codon:yes stop_codon:yes gene_type:complete
MTRTIHDIIEEISNSVEDMASNIDLGIGEEIHKENYQEMVFESTPASIAEMLFDLADQISLIQECVSEIESRINPELDFVEDLYDNEPQTCDKCNKTLSRKESRQ